MEKFENRFERIRFINNIVITSNEFMTAFTGIQDCVTRSISYSEPVWKHAAGRGRIRKNNLVQSNLKLDATFRKNRKGS